MVHDSAMRPCRVVLEHRLAGHLDQHHGRCDAGNRPQEQASTSDSPSSRSGANAQRDGDQHLHRRADEDRAPDLEQLSQAEAQADAEHEERHADLGELLDLVTIGDETGRERPDDQARLRCSR